MIKVKKLAYQMDNVLATVQYDIDGVEYGFTLGAKLLQIQRMTLDEIKTYIRKRVSSERDSKLRSVVEDKLSQLIDVELEDVV